MRTELNPHGYPELLMGSKADGSPLVIAAKFRSGVTVTNGAIYLSNPDHAYDPITAKEFATGLREAADWIEGDLSLAVEKFHAQRAAEAPESAFKRRPARTRVAVSKNAPLRELVWLPQDNLKPGVQPRPWIADDPQHPYRYSEDEVVDLTDVKMRKVTKHSLREVVDFMGAEDYATIIDEWPTVFRADLRNPGGGIVRLGWNSYVWKLPNGRCYVLGHGEMVFQTWALPAQPS